MPRPIQTRMSVFSDAAIRDLPSLRATEAQRFHFYSTDHKGLSLRVTVGKNTRSVAASTYGVDHKVQWHKLGVWGEDFTAEAAMDAALKLHSEHKADLKPSVKVGSLLQVANQWFDAVVKGEHRRAAGTRRIIDTYIAPSRWAKVPFLKMRRGEFAALLTEVQSNARREWQGRERDGKSIADAVLSKLSAITHWFANERDETYESPLTTKMRKDKRKAAEKARERTLTDAEIRLVWKAAEQSKATTFAAMVRFLLLTGVRRDKCATMQWEHVDLESGVWTIETDAREKGNAGTLPLPAMALALVKAQPRLASNAYVFAPHRGRKAFARFGMSKREFDGEVTALNGGVALARWTLHDLRRTFATVMNGMRDENNRPVVAPHITELLIGHSLGAIQRIYVRTDWTPDFEFALARYAEHLDGVVHPKPKLAKAA